MFLQGAKILCLPVKMPVWYNWPEVRRMRSGKNNWVGQHIAAARKRAGLTQEELAARLHVTRQTISNYESMRSQPDIQTLVQLADVFQVPVETLIYGERAARRSGSTAELAAFCQGLESRCTWWARFMESTMAAAYRKWGSPVSPTRFSWRRSCLSGRRR